MKKWQDQLSTGTAAICMLAAVSVTLLLLASLPLSLLYLLPSLSCLCKKMIAIAAFSAHFVFRLLDLHCFLSAEAFGLTVGSYSWT